MGGEKNAIAETVKNAGGSPPHGRGKGSLSTARSLETRITPAWAGKRDRAKGRGAGWEDHPRMGGEKHGKYPFVFDTLGSPPHGRGKA